MSDRSSRPRRLARSTPREVEDRVREARSSLPLAPPGLAPGAIYLVDPLGNVMMRFDERADSTAAARALTKDLQRLLKYSALGRGGRS